MLLTIISIVGGILLALAMVGLIAGLFHIIPDFWAGLLIAAFILIIVGAVVYGLYSPALPARPAGLFPQ